MVRTTLFTNKKYILGSGRELDLTAENKNGSVTLTVMFNVLDSVQNIGHSVLIRLDNKQNVSFESIPGTNKDDELSKPIEGLNGTDKPLRIFELNEIISVLQQFLQKIEKEIATA